MEPQSEYEARRSAWLAKQSVLQREFIRLGNARLLLAVTTGLLAWFAYGSSMFSAWWLLLPLAAFVVSVMLHTRVVSRRTCAERARRYYDRALARLANQWQGKGEAGERFRDANHVYAEDLDLFGKASLFELLCTARTAAGEDALAQCLLQPANAEAASGRQQAVRELSMKLDLREDLALLGEDVRSQVRADVLTRWGLAAAHRVSFPSAATSGCSGHHRAILLSGISISSFATLGFCPGAVTEWAGGVLNAAHGFGNRLFGGDAGESPCHPCAPDSTCGARDFPGAAFAELDCTTACRGCPQLPRFAAWSAISIGLAPALTP